MGILGKILTGVVGLATGGVGLLVKSALSKKKPIAAAPIPTRDDARAQADRDMLLARRRGAAADIISGASGEPSAAQIGRLVVGS